MAFDYNQAAQDAYELISEFGVAITLTLYGNEAGGFDPITGDELASSADIVVNGVGVMVDYRSDEIDGTNIIQGDAKILCSLVGTPEINMVVNFNSKAWRVVGIKTLQPAGEVIMYTLQVRA